MHFVFFKCALETPKFGSGEGLLVFLLGRQFLSEQGFKILYKVPSHPHISIRWSGSGSSWLKVMHTICLMEILDQASLGGTS